MKIMNVEELTACLEALNDGDLPVFFSQPNQKERVVTNPHGVTKYKRL